MPMFLMHDGSDPTFLYPLLLPASYDQWARAHMS
jgi:hypothetical protein